MKDSRIDDFLRGSAGGIGCDGRSGRGGLAPAAPKRASTSALPVIRNPRDRTVSICGRVSPVSYPRSPSGPISTCSAAEKAAAQTSEIETGGEAQDDGQAAGEGCPARTSGS